MACACKSKHHSSQIPRFSTVQNLAPKQDGCFKEGLRLSGSQASTHCAVATSHLEGAAAMSGARASTQGNSTQQSHQKCKTRQPPMLEPARWCSAWVVMGCTYDCQLHVCHQTLTYKEAAASRNHTGNHANVAKQAVLTLPASHT